MKPTDRSNLATLGVLGMLSGGVAWGLIMLIGALSAQDSYLSKLKGGNEIGIYEVRVLPGLIFGLVIGFLWHRRNMSSPRGVLGYALASTLAYFLAFEFALHTFDRWPGMSENLSLALSGIIAGLIGCCVLGIATAFLFRISYQSALGLPVLMGTAAGALLPLINLDDAWGVSWLVFYVLWQGAYAASLVRLMQPSLVMAYKPASIG
jgi:hypothetical protein